MRSGKAERNMSRTRNKRRPKPKPGAAKLNVDLDKKLAINSDGITTALIELAKDKNPTALHLILRWAEDAEFAEQCQNVHDSLLERYVAAVRADLDKEEKERAQQQSAATAVPADEPHS